MPCRMSNDVLGQPGTFWDRFNQGLGRENAMPSRMSRDVLGHPLIFPDWLSLG